MNGFVGAEPCRAEAFTAPLTSAAMPTAPYHRADSLTLALRIEFRRQQHREWWIDFFKQVGIGIAFGLPVSFILVLVGIFAFHLGATR